MLKDTLKGALIASAVAGMFAAGTAATAEKAKEGGDSVKCQGANACKGQSACSSAKNSCAGKNGCKGQGWSMAKDAGDCKAKGGKVM